MSEAMVYTMRTQSCNQCTHAPINVHYPLYLSIAPVHTPLSIPPTRAPLPVPSYP